MEVRLNKLPKTIEMVRDGDSFAFRFIDQRDLPDRLTTRTTRNWRAVVEAVKVLAVRGAPAIGISGAAALALWAQETGFADGIDEAASEIATARPTAVNLRWGVKRALETAHSAEGDLPGALYRLVCEMQEEDERVNRAIGANGAKLLPEGARVLTHCNAGSLATYFFGTALGVVYSAAAQGKIERVYADETRPVGQGARLTAWELAQAGIPVTLICDNMAASLMAQGRVDAVVVGADRIARNGDAANKIGTYGVAVLAHEHGVPFYVAAPMSTVDVETPDGAAIVIEERDPREVLAQPIKGVDVWNPAFDVTPARYITKIVTENGSFSPQELETRL